MKLPTKAYEAAYHKPNEVLIVKLAGMGHAEHGLQETGTAEMETPSRKSKETRSTSRNNSLPVAQKTGPLS